ncbi:MAG: Gfo/Idh/MocA family protein [Armatimonadota bacterium]
MAEPVRFGVIGFDFGHQGAFAGSLAQHPDAAIVGVADLPDASEVARQRGREFAASVGAPYFDDLAELLDAQAPAAVSLCLPPARNPEVVAVLCARGIHVRSDKPVADDLDGARRIAAAVRAAGVRFSFGFHAARFAPPVARAIGAVRAGRVGEVRVMNATFLQPKGPRYTISVEEAQRRRAAGEPSVGELANFGGYVLLALSAYAGARATSVYCESDAFFYESYRIAGIEDLALVSLAYEGGAVATAVIGRTTTQSLPATDVRHEVIGSKGVLHVAHGLSDRLFVYGQFRDGDPYERGGFEMSAFGRPSHELYVHDFVRAIIEGRDPELTVEDAVDYHATVETAYESARTHRVREVAR